MPNAGANPIVPVLPAIPDLARAQRILVWVTVLAIVLPVLLFLLLMLLSHSKAHATAQERADQMLRVAQEHALKTIETNRQLLERVLELLDNDYRDSRLPVNEAILHNKLKDYVRDLPQVRGISAVDAQGRPLAASQLYPLPANLHIRDRIDYKALRQQQRHFYITPIMLGQLRKIPFFSIDQARYRPDGVFDGIVMVSMEPDYFNDYYRQLVSNHPGMRLTLLQGEGAVLARSAPTPAEEQKLLHELIARQPAQFSRLLPGRQGQTYLALRQVGNYPLYVAVSYPESESLAGWYRDLLVMAAFLLLPMFGLVFVLLRTLRRLKSEAAVWQRWREEVTIRESMETTLKQSRRLEALGQLTGEVAHSFNNLLLVFSTSTLLLRRLLPPGSGEQTLETMERGVESGKRLTRQLLAFSRRQPLRPEVVDFARQMNDFGVLLQASIGSHVNLTLDVAEQVANIRVDGSELELALLNLALNARAAMPQGGELTVRALNVTLSGEPAGLQGDFVRIDVIDDGEGIAPEDMDRVFEPFFTTKADGTGLGLAQVYGFCIQSGGAVTISSEMDVGTCVTMYLPASQETAQNTTENPASPRPVGSAGRVLVVEDNADVARSTQTLLEHLGYSVDIAASADGALYRIMLDCQWDVIVSDVMMPGTLNGIGLALRLQQAQPDLPVLLVTGYAAELEQAQAAGLHVLAKPYSTGALERALHQVRMTVKT
ncbi:ATP-binding protein [Chitinimonas lacunae]|uniref:histidine kinase n=1 Tax=Chitinimonas lacunae TaxID=1963018 RepID=A0ABV8MVS0_9NEIS